MKTPKQNMTTTNVVKNILGFVAIVLIVPPFFSTIYKINQPSESTQYMNGAADRIQASMDRAKALQSQSAPEGKSDKASSYSADLGRMIETYNTVNKMHITTIEKYNADIDLMNAHNHLRTPDQMDLANQAKTAIDKAAANLEVVKKEIEKKMALEGFTASFEPDQKAPVVKVVDPIPSGELEAAVPVAAEDPVAANILNHYQNQ
jgi:hypothetical protein